MAALVQGCEATGRAFASKRSMRWTRFAIPTAKDLAAFALDSTEPKLRAAGRAVKARLEPAAVTERTPRASEGREDVGRREAGGVRHPRGRSVPRRKPTSCSTLGSTRRYAGKVPPEIILDRARRSRDPCQERPSSGFTRRSSRRWINTALRRDRVGPKSDKLATYLESLEGGDAEKGRNIFLNNSAVYCQRCHKLDGQGGDVGPQLNGIAADKEKDRRYLLESVVLPSAKIAKGFDTVDPDCSTDDRTVSGIIKSEDKKQMKLVTPEKKEIVVPVKDVDSRRTGPSAMPDDLHKKLTPPRASRRGRIPGELEGAAEEVRPIHSLLQADFNVMRLISGRLPMRIGTPLVPRPRET